MARIKDEKALMERVLKMLPKGIPASAIDAVECSSTPGDWSYWVYLVPGFKCVPMECHTIHEDTLKELESMIQQIEEWPDDPYLE